MTRNPEPLYVLDACALLRLAQAEPGMADILYSATRGTCRVLMHQINLGEVVYMIGKRHGWPVAKHKRDEISRLPIQIVPLTDALFWQAVEIKAHHALSYADAFAAALAIAEDATLLTADAEFATPGDPIATTQNIRRAPASHA